MSQLLGSLSPNFQTAKSKGSSRNFHISNTNDHQALKLSNISKFLSPRFTNSQIAFCPHWTRFQMSELRNLQTRQLPRHACAESGLGQWQSDGIIDEAGGPRVSLLGRISAPTACTPAGDCVSRARRIDQVVA